MVVGGVSWVVGEVKNQETKAFNILIILIVKRCKMITKKNLGFLILIFLILGVPLISAYWNNYWYYDSPLSYLDNEWVLFGAIFLIFFAVIFYTINQSFDNKAVSAVIATGISLLIALALARRGMLYGYVGDELGSWLLFVAALIAVGFLLKFVAESFGTIGTVVAVMAIWFVLYNVDPYETLPYELVTDIFLSVYSFITSPWGLGLLILLAIGFSVIMDSRDPFAKGFKQFSKAWGRRR